MTQPSATESAPTILITGSSRGVGLALAQYYAENGWSVLATCREPASASALQALADQRRNIAIEALDVSERASVEGLARRHDSLAIDVLMNNAGVLGDPEAQSAMSLDRAEFDKVLRTNTYGPLLMATTFMEHVARSRQKKIVTLTSGMSSIAFTEHFGRLYFYRASKAGINVAMRALQADVRQRGIIVAVVAPGIVDTDLLTESGYAGSAIEPMQSARRLYDYVQTLRPNTAKGFAVPPDRIVPW